MPVELQVAGLRGVMVAMVTPETSIIFRRYELMGDLSGVPAREVASWDILWEDAI